MPLHNQKKKPEKLFKRVFSSFIRKTPLLNKTTRIILEQTLLNQSGIDFSRIVVHQPREYVYPRVISIQNQTLEQLILRLPEDWVVTINNVYFYHKKRKLGIVTKGRILIEDLSHSNDSKENHPIFIRPYNPEATRIEGIVAIVTSCGSNEFFHYFSETLYMYYLYEKSKIKYDYLLTPTDKSYQREMLELLKIPQAKILPANNYPAIYPETIITSNSSSRYAFRSDYINFLRTKMNIPEGVNGKKRIFISRGKRGVRSIINEKSLFDYLEEKGFRKYTLEALTLKEQIKLFMDAEIIIAPHGAGLIHLIWAPKSTVVLELFHKSYTNQCFRALAQQCGHKYIFLVDDETPTEPKLKGLQDMNISLARVIKTLRKII